MSGPDVGTNDFRPEPTVERIPNIMILDTSISMKRVMMTESGEKRKIEHLKECLGMFDSMVENKELAASRVDIAVITFGGNVDVKQEFTEIEEWTTPELNAGGNALMGDAIEKGIDLAEQIKGYYKHEGIPYARPLLWLLTDGKSIEMGEGDPKWVRVQEQLEVGENNNYLNFFTIGIGDADMGTLNSLVEVTNRPALRIREGMFDEYFQFVSNSLEDFSTTLNDSEGVIYEEELNEFIQTEGETNQP